jgi:hypothetical protein
MFENYRECKHCMDGMKNEIGETLAFCELWDEWKNVTLGDCFGNCESQEEEFEYLRNTKLYNADPNCNHNIVPQLSGGVKCTKCGGWFCY